MMKKRLFSILLALCVVLALLPVTALAADASKLDSNTKKAYYDILSTEISKYGIVSKDGDYGVEYAALEDMDGDGSPELIVIRYEDGEEADTVDSADFYVWTMRNGKAVQTVNDGIMAGGALLFTEIFIVRRAGQMAVCKVYEWSERAYDENDGDDLLSIQLYFADGTIEEIIVDHHSPSKVEPTWDEFYHTWTIADAGRFLGAPFQWNHNDKADEAVKQLLAALSAAPAVKAVVSPQNLTVDGNAVECEKYNIDGSNYFKLRDLACALDGTGSQFEVGYDEETGTVTITTGEAYTVAGSELAVGVDNSATTQPSNQTIMINGEVHSELTVYNIGDSNFFQLRELGSILGFDVDFDVDTNTAVVRSVEQ